MESKIIRIMAVDDMQTHIDRLRRILEKEPDFQLVATANNRADAIERAEQYKPDIILMDIEMETPDAGIIVAQHINRELPDTKLNMLTMHMDDEVVFSAFQAGVVDYLLKSNEILAVDPSISPAILWAA